MANYEDCGPSAYDWDLIKPDWESGILTVDEMVKRHRISRDMLREKGREFVASGVWQERPRQAGRRPQALLDQAKALLAQGPVKHPDVPYYGDFTIGGREKPPTITGVASTEPRVIAYSKKVGERICDLVAQNWSLEEICTLPGMPATWRVMQWLRSPEHQDFCTIYWDAARAALLLQLDELDKELSEVVADTKKRNKNVSNARIQAIRERRQHLEFKVTNLLPHVFKGIGRATGRNAGDVENKSRLGGLAAIARKGTDQMLETGVIDPMTRKVNLKVVNGGKS